MGYVSNQRFIFYVWLLIIIIIAIFICVFFKTPDTSPEYSNKDTEINIYNQLDRNNDIAIEQLRKKYLIAKRIIPTFPKFPRIWLLPAPDKGNYSSIGERHCIEFFQFLFPKHIFQKVRPKWLRNPKTNYPLELDGFCQELMIAIEYNGIQHYVWPNFTKCSLECFLAQQERDQVKAQICAQQHICLIRIPYTVPLNRIPLAIYAGLLEAVPGLK